MWGEVPVTSSHRASLSPLPSPPTPSSAPSHNWSHYILSTQSQPLTFVAHLAGFLFCGRIGSLPTKAAFCFLVLVLPMVHDANSPRLWALAGSFPSICSCETNVLIPVSLRLLSVRCFCLSCRQRPQLSPATCSQSNGTSELAPALSLSDTELADLGAWF